MKQNILISKITILFVLLSACTYAQRPYRWSIDTRPSLNFPMKLFAGNELEPGFGFDAAVTCKVIGNASIYGGWGWSLFPHNKTNGNAMSVEKMGSSLGVKFTQPLNSFNLALFAKGGATYQHVKVEKFSEKRYHSGREWGWQIETGLSLPLDQHVALEPGLKYASLSGSIGQDGSTQTFHMNDLSAGVILSIKFGK